MAEGPTRRGTWRRLPAGAGRVAPGDSDPPGTGPDGSQRPERAVAGKDMASAPDEPVRMGFDVTPDEPEEAPDPRVRVRRGGCLCGAVRYEVRGEPKVVGLCHCGDCRKATGGFAMPYADWPNDALRIAGQVATFQGRSFCPSCGSRVVHLSPHHAEIILGTLDEAPFDLAPTREVWTIRRQPWQAPVAGAAQFERDAD